MEKGGNLDSRLNAILVDGNSPYAWPMSGFTYVIIRTNATLGTCDRRKAAMEYLYQFYHSDTVKAIAKRYSFAVLPSFIRDIVVSKLVNSVHCPDGSYALAKYRAESTSFLTSSIMSSALNVYMTVYSEVDSSATLSTRSSDTSNDLWSSYLLSPESYAGVLTVFGSADVKKSMYSTASSMGLDTITSSFAHFSVLALYHLNSFPSSASLLVISWREYSQDQYFTGMIREFKARTVCTSSICPTNG